MGRTMKCFGPAWYCRAANGISIEDEQMTKRSEQPIVAPAPPEQRIGEPLASSGRKGKPLDYLLARVEAKHPGIEEEIGLSSAAARAGRQVREMRQAKGWTQVRLAEALGWDQ